MWTYVIVVLNSDYLLIKKLLERFTKKNCKNQVVQSLELKMQSKEKMINYMSTGKAMIILLTFDIII